MADATASETNTPPPPSLARDARILVVEDNRMARDFLTGILREMGADVDSAHNGEMGMRILQTGILNEQNYHLVILDLMMPKMNGLELLRYIRNDTGLRTTPVIVLTSGQEQELADECSRHSISSFLRKPARPGAIREAVESALACSAHSFLLRNGLTRDGLETLRRQVETAAREAIAAGAWTARRPEDDAVYRLVMNWLRAAED